MRFPINSTHPVIKFVKDNYQYCKVCILLCHQRKADLHMQVLGCHIVGSEIEHPYHRFLNILPRLTNGPIPQLQDQRNTMTNRLCVSICARSYFLNVYIIKIRSKHNSDKLLSLLRIFMKQTSCIVLPFGGLFWLRFFFRGQNLKIQPRTSFDLKGLNKGHAKYFENRQQP